MPEKLIGKITHYFSNIGVGVIELSEGELKVGETIHIKGSTTDLNQKVESLQVDKKPVDKIGVGESAGLKVSDHVRENDEVYLVEEEEAP